MITSPPSAENPDWKPVLTTRFELGEGARAISGGRSVFVNLLAGELWRLDAEMRSADLIGRALSSIGAVAPLDDSATTFLAAAGRGFAVVSPDGVRPVPGTGHLLGPAERMNDGSSDPHGRFWAGSMSISQEPGAGALWRMDLDGSVAKVLTGLTIPNGPVFSHDGATMFLADSAAQTIYSIQLEPGTGRLLDREVFATVTRGYPDGMTLDDAGHLWVAIWGVGTIHCYTPSGTLLRILHIPAKQPTSLCFTGRGRTSLMVTSATYSLNNPSQDDGRTFSADVGATGSPALPARVLVNSD